jgi:choline-sulfatase
LIDIAPTVLDNANLAVDPTLPGRSLVAIANEKDDSQRIGFSEYHAVGSPSAAYLVRQGQWAYHHYVGFEPELFDMAADPGQTVNLVAHDSYRTICERMETLLCQMLDPEATDQLAKADQDALIAQFGGREAALGKGPAGASPVPSRVPN